MRHSVSHSNRNVGWNRTAAVAHTSECPAIYLPRRMPMRHHHMHTFYAMSHLESVRVRTLCWPQSRRFVLNYRPNWRTPVCSGVTYSNIVNCNIIIVRICDGNSVRIARAKWIFRLQIGSSVRERRKWRTTLLLLYADVVPNRSGLSNTAPAVVHKTEDKLYHNRYNCGTAEQWIR